MPGTSGALLPSSSPSDQRPAVPGDFGDGALARRVAHSDRSSFGSERSNVLSPFARALTYYLCGGFALALLCAIWYLDRPSEVDARWHRRVRRRAVVLLSLGLGHPVVALAAVGIALDLGRTDAGRSGPLLPMAVGSLTVSLAAMASILAVTA